MRLEIWYLLIGTILISMALASTLIKRLPLSSATLYLFIGVILGTINPQSIWLDPIKDAKTLEIVAEIAVLISLFSAGLNLRLSVFDQRWWISVRLATISMVITIGLMMLAGMWLIGMSIGIALLLGAILAPTDPVLAADIGVESPGDMDKLRLGLTGEAGMNDGAAFPFIMLALGLLGLHELGPYGQTWFIKDVLQATVAGIASGWLLGISVGHIVLKLRREHKEAVGLDEFIALGLLALSYGTALLLNGYGFLAVFFAGLALRRIEHKSSGKKLPEDVLIKMDDDSDSAATHVEKAPAYMAREVMTFNQQLERIAEVGVVLLIGGILSMGYFSVQGLIMAVLLFVVIRPISVKIGLIGSSTSRIHGNLMSWFGIRGVGSIYYLSYAINHGLAPQSAKELINVVITVVACSIIVHGISATPLMSAYRRIQTFTRRT